MKTVVALLRILCVVFLLVHSGCEPSGVATKSAAKTSYAPAKIDILPLTGLIDLDDPGQQPQLRAYVSLLDSFGSQIKAPGVFRFELYEYVQRSSEPKGRRISIWPDTNLTAPVDNDTHWRDFLRAYEFILLFEPTGDQSYILQATCLCPDGRRLSAEFALKPPK